MARPLLLATGMRASCLGVVLGTFLLPWVEVDLRLVCAALLSCVALGVATRWRAAGLLAGVSLGLLAAPIEGPVLRGPVSVQGIVVGAPTGRSVEIAVQQVGQGTEGSRPAVGRLRLIAPERAPTPGARVVARGRAFAPHDHSLLPGEPDPAWSARRTGVQTVLRADRLEVLGGSARRDSLPGILGALATGDRSDVSESTWLLLRRTGTAHLLAISGFHVGLVAGVFGSLVLALLRGLALFWPRGVNPGLAWLAGAMAGWAYAVLAGAPVSALRAAGLLTLIAVGRALGRPIEPFRLLLVVAAALALADPGAIASPGYQLSFGAVSGLICLTHGFLRWLPPDLPWLVRWPLTSAAVTTAATLGTLPAAAWWFQSVALWSIPANLIAIPYVSLLLGPLAFLAQLWPGALPAGVWASEGLLMLLRPFDTTPLSPAVGPVGALLLLPVIFFRGPFVRLGALGVLLLRPVLTVDLRATFLDVGQGDATLLEFRDGSVWLVDGGPPSDRVLRYLRRRGVRELDVVVATHGQADHVGGLFPVLEELRVGELRIPEPVRLGALIAVAGRRGAVVTVGRGLHPRPPVAFSDLNDRSLVVAPASAVLLTGDIEAAAEAELAASLPSFPILKVAHHGSKSSTTPRFVEAVDPLLAVISAGRHNRYGHPHPSVLTRLADRVVYRTDRHGTVEVVLDGEELRVRTHRAGRGFSGVEAYRLPKRRPPTPNTPMANTAISKETPWE